MHRHATSHVDVRIRRCIRPVQSRSISPACGVLEVLRQTDVIGADQCQGNLHTGVKEHTGFSLRPYMSGSSEHYNQTMVCAIGMWGRVNTAFRHR